MPSINIIFRSSVSLAATMLAFATTAPTALAQVVIEQEVLVAPPEIPATPLAALDIVLIRPFTLAQPYENEWRAERTPVRGGALLVVDLPPDATVPRQVAEPVLLIGGRVAERLHVAWPHGRAVVVVPTDLDANGEVILDLTAEPIFFGTPELPERVDAAWLATELAAATAAGIVPFPADRVATARRRGGDKAVLADRRALLAAVAGLIRTYVPDQDEVAETLLLNAMTE